MRMDFQRMDIRDIDPDLLVERSRLVIDRKLPQKERLAQYCKQTNNHPDCLLVDGVVVLSRFADTDTTIEDRLCAVVRNL